MSGREVLWRCGNLLRDQLDLARVPMGLLPRLPPTVHADCDAFKPGFSCSPADRAFWKRQVHPKAPDWQDRLIARADAILDNRLSYLDRQDQFLGDPVNWHRDFSAGVDAPLRLCSLIDYRDFDSVGDCKQVWEPNRHHQLVVLARAYTVSGERRYAEKLAELMRSWIDGNPFGYGMNWKSPLEVGIRIINWVWAIDLVRKADVFGKDLWADVLQTLYLAIWDTQRKFSRGSSANNHLIGEAAGVYIGACYCAEFPGNRGWRTAAKSILEEEILAQSYDDGCTREHAFGYQFFVLQFFTLSAIAAKATGDDFSAEFMDRLHRMYRFMSDICADTGSPPNLGDQDDGYVLDLGELPDSARELIAAGQVLFDDQALAAVNGSETNCWLFGTPGPDMEPGQSTRASSPYPRSGYYILRSDPGRRADGGEVSVFFDCAELGFGAIAAHGHADCLSFCLNVGTRPVFVDPGTYDYFSHPEWRDYFRQTRAHNTAEVDGCSQSESLGLFLWGRRANPGGIEWRDDEFVARVSAEHDGYRRLTDPLIHRRTLTLDKGTRVLQIDDSFSCRSSHGIAIHFHLDPACSVTQTSDASVRIEVAGRALILSTQSGSMRIEPARDGSQLGWISRSYHRMEASHTIVLGQDIAGDTSIRSTIAPA